MSPEENAELDRLIKLSGMTKQDYIIDRLSNKEIIVTPNPRVFKALKNEIVALTEEMKRLSESDCINNELIEILKTIVKLSES